MNTTSSAAIRIAPIASQLSPKRRTGGRGIDAWYPYYAGFSHEFVSSVLKTLLEHRPATVLDPWAGSGTTTAAAFAQGHRALGFDLNPVAVLLANAKLTTPTNNRRFGKLLDECLDFAVHKAKHSKLGHLPLMDWLPPTTARFGHFAIDWLCRQGKRLPHELTPSRSLVALCIIFGMRSFAVDPRKSNLAWSSPNPQLATLRTKSLVDKIREHAAFVSAIPSRKHRTPGLQPHVKLGDARSLSLESASIDIAVSSPPYCTRIDYAKQTSFELAAIAGDNYYPNRQLRDSLMGTTTIRQSPTTKSHLPTTITQLLEQVANHPSHRSASYYAKNFRQYFDDAQQAIGEMGRVLKPGGVAVLVLQNSFYKEIEIPLSQLYCDLAHSFGLAATISAKTRVPHTMTSINSKARRYRESRSYTEDIVVIESTP